MEDAGALFSQFANLAPDSTVAWLSEYRRLAKPYQEQFTTFALATDAWKNAANDREKTQALVALRELPGKLPKDSKLAAKAGKILAEAVSQMNATWVDKNRGNFAFRAKARTSPKGEAPEKAVDGDRTTAWTAPGPAPKWLALDLGAPRNISRWALTTGAFGETKLELNLAGFKLQRSDDGESWTDVDTVQDNRSGTIDRVVPPFTARQVRVLVTKETGNPNNKMARIYELSLGAAADQAKAGYEPAQSVAIRFSEKTGFVSGPIGDSGLAGSAQFSEADGKFTIKGSGADIAKQNDAFYFVWQPVAGDCEIVARVLSVQPANTPTRVGIDIRSDLTKDASHAGMFALPGKKVRFISRVAPGKLSTDKDTPNAPLPRWLKLARQGAVVIGYESADGQKWTETGRETLAGIRGVAYVGLAVCSHEKEKLATAQFSDVRIQKTKP